jgi:hypothetical protein
LEARNKETSAKPANNPQTFSGNFSLFIEASKQSPKSMCNILPLQKGGTKNTYYECMQLKPMRSQLVAMKYL